MNNLRVPNGLKRILTVTATSLIPSLLIFLYNYCYLKDADSASTAWLGVITAAISCGCLWIGYRLLPLFPFFRPFRKYEGRWLQIIPEKEERPISVINFKFKNNKYILTGYNFNEQCNSGLEFKSDKFIKRDHYEGFYYITGCSIEQTNSLGKIGFIENNVDNLTRAEGYFFDSSNSNCSRKYHTIMIKCDKNFFMQIQPLLQKVNYKKLPEKMVAEMSWDFAKQEIEAYNQQQSSKCKNNCPQKL